MSYPVDPNQPQTPPQPPQYQMPQYSAPQYAAQQPPTNSMALIAMISSIVGFFSFGVLAVLGVVLGHISLSQIRRTGEGGRGLGITALVVGYIAIAGYLIALLFVLLLLPFVFSASSVSGG